LRIINLKPDYLSWNDVDKIDKCNLLHIEQTARGTDHSWARKHRTYCLTPPSSAVMRVFRN
jgi:hypothetical protein